MPNTSDAIETDPGHALQIATGLDQRREREHVSDSDGERAELEHRACRACCPQSAREGPEPIGHSPEERGGRTDRRLAANELDEDDEESNRGEHATDRRSLHPHELREHRHHEDRGQECRTYSNGNDNSNRDRGRESRRRTE